MSILFSQSGSSYGVTYTWVQGDTINDSILIQSSPGTPLDISGCNFYFTIKPNPLYDDNHATLRITWLVVSGASGVTAIQAAKAQTIVIQPGNYIFDWVMVDTSGNSTTLMTSEPTGAMVILPRSTLSH